MPDVEQNSPEEEDGLLSDPLVEGGFSPSGVAMDKCRSRKKNARID